jgi:hypothetical protein
VVRYTATLDGMPSGFIPPIAPDIRLPGLRSHSDEPKFADNELATRLERVTYLFENGGEFEIPGVRIDWWNLEKNSLDNTALEPIPLSIAGEPAAEIQTVNGEESPWRLWRRLAPSLLLLAVLVAMGIRLTPRVRAALQVRRIAYERSEAHAYDQLRSALTSADHEKIQTALIRWRKTAVPEMSLHEFAAGYGSPRLAELIANLGASLYGNARGGFDSAEATVLFKQARNQWLHTDPPAVESLPQLNP